ncbi:MAG: LytTR family DNA-binding domain-containing protein [Candidatus Eisenbacteria bacterium]
MTARPPLRVLIVDDEPLARDSVRVLLSADVGVDVVGECGNGSDAVEAIRELDPDLVFLDVEMPGMNGFDVLAELTPDEMPWVVFVTAYSKYAVDAFEVNAVDYVLKPFDDERFAEALSRAKDRVEPGGASGTYGARLLRLLEEHRSNSPGAPRSPRIAIRESGRIYFVAVDEIDWVAGAGNHVEIHAGGTIHLHRTSLGTLEEELGPERFCRIHRSTLVRIDRVAELRSRARGDYDVVLRDGTSLVLSRRHPEALKRLLGE